MLKPIKTFESYRELDRYDYKDDYDYAFANYALNERPLFLDEYERQEARQLYGGTLDGIGGDGIVYRGAKINTEEQLKQIKDLQAKGGTISLRLGSASHHYSTAKSFADYVKSYDTSTMLAAMKDTMEQGSAGKFGTYIVYLKPTKDQIIYNTARGTLTSGAESEVILYGDIKVVKVEINEPLTEDNYINRFMAMDNIGALISSDFFAHWLSNRRLEIPLNRKIEKLKQLVKTTDDVVLLMENAGNLRLIEYNVVMDYLADHNLLKKTAAMMNFKVASLKGVRSDLNDPQFRQVDLYYKGRKVNTDDKQTRYILNMGGRNSIQRKIDLHNLKIKESNFDRRQADLVLSKLEELLGGNYELSARTHDKWFHAADKLRTWGYTYDHSLKLTGNKPFTPWVKFITQFKQYLSDISHEAMTGDTEMAAWMVRALVDTKASWILPHSNPFRIVSVIGDDKFRKQFWGSFYHIANTRGIHEHLPNLNLIGQAVKVIIKNMA
jgi:hypothetical protein